MPRKPHIPTYRLHKQSGQAIVTLTNGLGDRHDVLLGLFGSPESRAEYARVIAEWEAQGQNLTPRKGSRSVPHSLSINELLVAFLRHAEQYFRLPDGSVTSEVREYKSSLRPLKELYGHTPAADFGPLALKSVREKLIEAGLSRLTVNQRAGRVKRVFKWGVENELVPPGVLVGLQAVKGLQRGRSEARESKPVRPVSERVVQDTLPLLNRHIRAMVELQLLGGMRPAEVCLIRGCDLDVTGKVWLYRPGSDTGREGRHKTAHHGRSRVIALGPKAQAVLKPFLKTDTQAYLFSPREARDEFDAARREARVTPMTPSQRKRCRKASPGRTPGERYTSTSYAHAIARVIERHNEQEAARAVDEGREPQPIPLWSPNKLRHARATEVRRAYGLEAAQVVLGHARADVTQVYAERDLALAERIALEIG